MARIKSLAGVGVAMALVGGACNGSEHDAPEMPWHEDATTVAEYVEGDNYTEYMGDLMQRYGERMILACRSDPEFDLCDLTSGPGDLWDEELVLTNTAENPDTGISTFVRYTVADDGAEITVLATGYFETGINDDNSAVLTTVRGENVLRNGVRLDGEYDNEVASVSGLEALAADALRRLDIYLTYPALPSERD